MITTLKVLLFYCEMEIVEKAEDNSGRLPEMLFNHVCLDYTINQSLMSPIN